VKEFGFIYEIGRIKALLIETAATHGGIHTGGSLTDQGKVKMSFTWMRRGLILVRLILKNAGMKISLRPKDAFMAELTADLKHCRVQLKCDGTR
jgi:hypothetical protein